MKGILPGLCAILVLLLLFFLFKRMLRQSRSKTMMYKHKSELDPTPISFAMGEEEEKKKTDFLSNYATDFPSEKE